MGTSLPKSLDGQYYGILQREYGIDDPHDLAQQERIPKEFTFDEWWKNEGYDVLIVLSLLLLVF